jgi:uncharacterized protein YbjT (DUF2867 family)
MEQPDALKLFVLGATGRTGSAFVKAALARGHSVTALVRSPQKVTPRERLEIMAGDPRRTADVEAALGGHDAVVSAIGPKLRDALAPSSLLADCAASAAAAMTRKGVERLAIVSAALLFPGGGLHYAFLRWMIRHHLRDLRGMEAIVSASGLAWTIARPPKLVLQGDARYQARNEAMPGGHPVLSFESVAAFLLDRVEQREHVGHVVGLSA